MTTATVLYMLRATARRLMGQESSGHAALQEAADRLEQYRAAAAECVAALEALTSRQPADFLDSVEGAALAELKREMEQVALARADRLRDKAQWSLGGVQ